MSNTTQLTDDTVTLAAPVAANAVRKGCPTEVACRMAAEVATFAQVVGDGVENMTGAEFAALFAEWRQGAL